MPLKLQDSYVYGPVLSRRLGVSLGINILPRNKKVCTFECAYCHYGWRTTKELEESERASFPPVSAIVAEVEQALRAIDPKPDYITFSGNGEPTLHPHFPELTEEIVRFRNRYSPRSRTALLSNSSRIMKEPIARAVAKLDLRIMKFECPDDRSLHRYNRPRCNVSVDKLVEALRSLEDVTIQALFSGGEGGNYDRELLDEWIDRIARISPTHVQLYTLGRYYPSTNIHPLSRAELLGIKRRLSRRCIRSSVYV